MIACSIVLFLAATALLYLKWATMTEPSCVLIIRYSPALSGAQIKVDGLQLTSGALKAETDSLRLSTPFYLDPGEYTIDITLNDQLQYHGAVRLARGTQVDLDLTRLRPTINPSTLPDATPF